MLSIFIYLFIFVADLNSEGIEKPYNQILEFETFFPFIWYLFSPSQWGYGKLFSIGYEGK